MIKVNYDENGKILGFYSNKIKYDSIPTPYIEISEQLYSNIVGNYKKYAIINNSVVDVSNTEEYLKQQTDLAKAQEIAKIKQEIETLETSQHRAIRESIVNPNSYATDKLVDIDNKILKLRNDLYSISN